MQSITSDNTVIIIGAGFAGLSAGIYAQMNGYNARIFEMHDQPGGLCTAWKKKGYTIDGCIHWLVGSSPKSGMHDLWKEVGIAQGRQFINMDEYVRFVDNDGRTLIFYTDIDRLERHLMEFSPRDSGPISEMISGIRMCLNFDTPSKNSPGMVKFRKGLKLLSVMAFKWRKIKAWAQISAEEFSHKFKDPLLAEAIREMWIPEFSMLFMLFTFAYLHNKNAGYPIGGSMPMSKALEKRFTDLGGMIHYGKKVEKILVTEKRAVGIQLEGGEAHHGRLVISAADGHTTIYKMLDGKFGDFKDSEPYEKWPVFPPLIYVGLGVNRSFDDEPRSVSGFLIRLKKPLEIAEKERNWLWVHPFNHDPTLAPGGKTSLVIMMQSSYEYWKELGSDRKAYMKKKEQIVQALTGALEERYPGIASQIEAADVATPLTFERYTGNWKGSYEGWLITPKNAGTLIKKMPQTITGLENFFLCGQWVEPGGGLPTSVMSAKRLIKKICSLDNKKFSVTSV